MPDFDTEGDLVVAALWNRFLPARLTGLIPLSWPGSCEALVAMPSQGKASGYVARIVLPDLALDVCRWRAGAFDFALACIGLPASD